MQFIKKEPQKTDKVLTEIALAERHLNAAIRMYFLELDPVAIHTVSSAAHMMITRLMANRGQHMGAQGAFSALLYAAKDLRDGNLSEDDIHDWGENALELVKLFSRMLEENQDVEVEELVSRIPKGLQPDMSEEIHSESLVSGFEFLSGDKPFNETEINNEERIMEAILSSQHLLKAEPSMERVLFFDAMIALGMIDGKSSYHLDLDIFATATSADEIMAAARQCLFGDSLAGAANIRGV